MKKNTKFTLSALLFKWTLIAGTAALVSACGSSDSSTNTNTNLAGTPADLQGRWSATSVGSTPGYTAIVLAKPTNAANVWLLAQDATRVAKLSMSSSFAVTGKIYDLNKPSSAVTVINGSATSDTASSTKTLTLLGVLPAALIMNNNDTLVTPALQSDVVGNWKFTTDAGSLATTWSVNNTGTVGIVSSPACVYAGTLTAMATATAYVAYFTEKCPGSDEVLNSGIATLNGDKTRLTVVTTTANEEKATVLFFTK